VSPDPVVPASLPQFSTFCDVTALHVQLVQNSEVIDVRLSNARAILSNLNPASCPIFDLPDLSGSTKIPSFITDTPPAGASNGDKINFTLRARNTGAVNATNLRFVDRIPTSVTVDQASILLDGATTPFTIGNCPGNLSFTKCAGEAASDTSRQCLTVQDGALNAGQIKNLTFSVTVNGNPSTGVCNDALILVDQIPPTEITTTVLPPGGGTTSGGTATAGATSGELIRTTGSGGCSIGEMSKAGRGQLLPVFAMALALVLRGVRKRKDR
jgi:uncharacterized repeat protein (TIGR01451 family)